MADLSQTLCGVRCVELPTKAVKHKDEDRREASTVAHLHRRHLKAEFHHPQHHMVQNDRNEHIQDQDVEQAVEHSRAMGLYVSDAVSVVITARIAHRRRHRMLNVVSKQVKVQMW